MSSSATAVTASLAVRNEERLIGRCLASLEGVVDEIVVVHDGQCEDRTLDIAARYGCRIFIGPAVGHAEYHRVFVAKQARGEWLLHIDADEFLSPELRKSLPSLAARKDVNGFEFIWRLWDGQRYFTEGGPFKLALFRRNAAHMLGLLQASPRIEGHIERTSLHLEHQPLYDNWRLRTMVTKWRRWARIQAREYLSDFVSVPKFNYEGSDWPSWRKIANRLSPVLVLPYFVSIALVMLWRQRSDLPLRFNLKVAIALGAYNAMVQAYIAAYLYVPCIQSGPSPPATGWRELEHS